MALQRNGNTARASAPRPVGSGLTDRDACPYRQRLCRSGRGAPWLLGMSAQARFPRKTFHCGGFRPDAGAQPVRTIAPILRTGINLQESIRRIALPFLQICDRHEKTSPAGLRHLQPIRSVYLAQTVSSSHFPAILCFRQAHNGRLNASLTKYFYQI